MVAVAGVVVLSYEEDSSEEGSNGSVVARRSLALALVSALGFGTMFTLLDVIATDRPGWAIVSARTGGVTLVLVALALTRPALGGVPAALPALVAVGALDITANSLFTVASTIGLLPVVAVGGSMYPAFTIALAHVVLGERLRAPQRLGVAMALAGVALIAAGGA